MKFLKNYRIIEPIDCKTWDHRISRQTKRGNAMVMHISITTEKVYVVEAHVLSQEDRPGTPRTIPGISRETDISRQKWRHNVIVSKVYLLHVGKFKLCWFKFEQT